MSPANLDQKKCKNLTKNVYYIGASYGKRTLNGRIGRRKGAEGANVYATSFSWRIGAGITLNLVQFGRQPFVSTGACLILSTFNASGVFMHALSALFDLLSHGI